LAGCPPALQTVTCQTLGAFRPTNLQDSGCHRRRRSALRERVSGREDGWASVTPFNDLIRKPPYGLDGEIRAARKATVGLNIPGGPSFRRLRATSATMVSSASLRTVCSTYLMSASRRHAEIKKNARGTKRIEVPDGIAWLVPGTCPLGHEGLCRSGACLRSHAAPSGGRKIEVPPANHTIKSSHRVQGRGSYLAGNLKSLPAPPGASAKGISGNLGITPSNGHLAK